MTRTRSRWCRALAATPGSSCRAMSCIAGDTFGGHQLHHPGSRHRQRRPVAGTDLQPQRDHQRRSPSSSTKFTTTRTTTRCWRSSSNSTTRPPRTLDVSQWELVRRRWITSSRRAASFPGMDSWSWRRIPPPSRRATVSRRSGRGTAVWPARARRSCWRMRMATRSTQWTTTRSFRGRSQPMAAALRRRWSTPHSTTIWAVPGVPHFRPRPGRDQPSSPSMPPRTSARWITRRNPRPPPTRSSSPPK